MLQSPVSLDSLLQKQTVSLFVYLFGVDSK